MNAEVKQDEILNVFKWCAANPAVIPVNGRMAACQITDQAAANHLAHICHMRRPATVLIDRQFDVIIARQLYQILAF